MIHTANFSASYLNCDAKHVFVHDHCAEALIFVPRSLIATLNNNNNEFNKRFVLAPFLQSASWHPSSTYFVHLRHIIYT